MTEGIVAERNSYSGTANSSYTAWPYTIQSSAVRIFEIYFESNSYFSIRLETSTIIRNFRILTLTNFLLI